MEPLNDENKLHVDEKNQKWKKKHLETNNIINFKTICHKLTALSNIIHSILS